MKESLYKFPLWFVLGLMILSPSVNAQNRNFMVNLAIGAGNSGFSITNADRDEISNIYYPTGGLQFQKRINDKWAINLYPSVSMSGNKRVLDQAENGITELKTFSKFINVAIHPKYYLKDKWYFSIGPEFSYLMSNYGSSYIDDERQSNIEETELFNRFNILVSSSFGFSKKIEESRKNAPIQIDCLWFLELRVKKGVNNILDTDAFIEDLSATILSFEIATGFSFATQH